MKEVELFTQLGLSHQMILNHYLMHLKRSLKVFKDHILLIYDEREEKRMSKLKGKVNPATATVEDREEHISSGCYRCSISNLRQS